MPTNAPQRMNQGFTGYEDHICPSNYLVGPIDAYHNHSRVNNTSQPRNSYKRSETYLPQTDSISTSYQDTKFPIVVSDNRTLEIRQTFEGLSVYILVNSNSDAVVRISRLYSSLSARDLKVHQGYSDCIMGYVFVVVKFSGDIHNTLQRMPYFDTRKKRLASLEDHISRSSNILSTFSRLSVREGIYYQTH
jgi:hypothetical protein